MAQGKLFPYTFESKDLFSSATMTCPAGQYTEIGFYKVQADEEVGIGRGGYGSLNEAIGRLFARFYDNAETTPVQFTNGRLRIEYRSSQDTFLACVLDVSLSALTTGETIPADRFPLPFGNILCGKDRKIVFSIKNESASSVTLSKANSKVLMDVTRSIL